MERNAYIMYSVDITPWRSVHFVIRRVSREIQALFSYLPMSVEQDHVY